MSNINLCNFMQMRLPLSLLVMIFLLYGCHNRCNFFSNNIKIVDSNFEISDTIRGEKLPVSDIYSMTSLICFDEYLLVLTPRANNIFNVLTFDGEIISQFGTKGRANDEVMNCQFNGQIEKIGGNNCVWISDVGKSRLVLIDIDKSMENGKITIMKEMKTPPMSVYSFCVNDSMLIAEQLSGNNFELLKHNISSNSFFQETLYKDDYTNAFSLYKSIWRLDSCKNRIIGAMQSVNQINVYSINDQERCSIVIGEQWTDKKELIDNETGLERTSTFCDLEIAGSYIYALYMNQDFNESYEKAKPLDLLIFDLDGNLDRVVRVNDYVFDITISSNGEYLYGRTPNDEIYRYKF